MLSLAEIQAMRTTVEDYALSMTCTIQRASVTSTDPFGQPTTTWANTSTNVPCFYWEQSEREVTGNEINAVFSGAFVQFMARTDVHAGDRITNVVALDGVTVAAALDIESVVTRETDVVAKVEAVA